jgi:dienelactone hydrolase
MAFTVALVRALLVASLCATGICTLPAQELEITPTQALCDGVAILRASGLRPNEIVTIQAVLVDGDEHHWSSEAEFLTDSQGTVDVSRQAPLKGSYNEVSAMGLVWSMKPEDKNTMRYSPPRELGTQIIQFRLLDNGKSVAKAEYEQRKVADGVRQIKVQGELHGVFFAPGMSGSYPGVLVVGRGGAPQELAAWLASHGFAAFALAYFGYDDLPKELEAIPLEYFGRALAWMKQRPEVMADRIAVLGNSRGAELALQLGSMYPHIRAVVAYVPANVRFGGNGTRVPYAWTWQGHPLAYILPQRGLFNNPGAALPAQIPVEQTHGPVLLISGDDDETWPSSIMANAIVNRLKDAHFQYRVEHLRYPHAGHLAGRPEIVPAWHREVERPFPGGTAKGDAESSLDAIPKVLEFLQASLQTAPPVK